MTRSSHLVTLLVPVLMLVVMCQPVSAQLAGLGLPTLGGGGLASNVAATIPGVDMLDSIGTGETIGNVLDTLGVNQRVIDTIVTPIANTREAANTVRDMVMSNAASRREAVDNVMAQIATPGQAISAFNDLMNGAFRDAAAQLAASVFNRGGSTGLFRTSILNGSDGNDTASLFRSNDRGVGVSVPVGFGLPVDVSVFGSGFTAGTGLPPIAAATQADLSSFAQQLYGDITRQYNAVAQFQKEADKKAKAEKQMYEACVQYALSEFLRTFANTLLTVGQPAGAIFSVLGQFAGLGYGGLTPQGDAYLNAYCCKMIRRSGISFQLPSAIDLGSIGVNTDALLDLPAAAAEAIGGPAAAAAVSAVTDALTGGFTGPDAGGAVQGAQVCTVLDWLAFALQGDRQLQKRFSDLLDAVLNLNVRVFGNVHEGASRARTAASRNINRVAGGPGAGTAAIGNPTLGGLLDVVGLP